jgi:hypothetical protein
LIAEIEDAPYTANHHIFEQGAQAHESAKRSISTLAQQNVRNDVRWYRNFFSFALIFNLLGFTSCKATQFFKHGTATHMSCETAIGTRVQCM